MGSAPCSKTTFGGAGTCLDRPGDRRPIDLGAGPLDRLAVPNQSLYLLGKAGRGVAGWLCFQPRQERGGCQTALARLCAGARPTRPTESKVTVRAVTNKTRPAAAVLWSWRFPLSSWFRSGI